MNVDGCNAKFGCGMYILKRKNKNNNLNIHRRLLIRTDVNAGYNIISLSEVVYWNQLIEVQGDYFGYVVSDSNVYTDYVTDYERYSVRRSAYYLSTCYTSTNKKVNGTFVRVSYGYNCYKYYSYVDWYNQPIVGMPLTVLIGASANTRILVRALTADSSKKTSSCVYTHTANYTDIGSYNVSAQVSSFNTTPSTFQIKIISS